MALSRMNFPLTTMLCVLILSLITLCSASDNNSRNKPRDNKPLPSCNGGQTGMWTYITCVPGAPRAPDRDGAKGDLGSPGKTGLQGPRGVAGKNGAKGEPGIQGCTGQKGERGDKGDCKTTRLSLHMNWKECTWKKEDGKDSGVIYNCDFIKNFTDTALHVYFAGNLRIHNCDHSCSRWYFTFNGAECSSPGPIEGLFYMYKDSRRQNLLHHRHIEGHCNNIQKGKVEWDSGLESVLAGSFLTGTPVGIQCPGYSLKRCQSLSSRRVSTNQQTGLSKKQFKTKNNL